MKSIKNYFVFTKRWTAKLIFPIFTKGQIVELITPVLTKRQMVKPVYHPLSTNRQMMKPVFSILIKKQIVELEKDVKYPKDKDGEGQIS